MADEARSPDPRTPLPPRDPKRGDMRVERAPEKPPMLPWSGRRFLVILAVLFLLNWLIVAHLRAGRGAHPGAVQPDLPRRGARRAT